MNIQPSSDVLIVREIEADNKTQGGLIIPDQVIEKDSLAKAEVLRAGLGRVSKNGTPIPHEFKVGDIIVYDKMRGLPVTYGNQKFIFINAHQVFGKVDEVSN